MAFKIKRATWARDGRKKGPDVISFSVKPNIGSTWDEDNDCRMYVPGYKACSLRPSQTRGWVNTSWNWGDVKVHIDDWEEPDSDNQGNGYCGEMIVTAYKLHPAGWKQYHDFTLYYDYDRYNITLGDVFKKLDLNPVED